MNTELTQNTKPTEGLTVEHILLSVTVVSDKTSAGQFDDSCSFILERELTEKYSGVLRVNASVQYKHTKIEHHIEGCECGHCKPMPGGAPSH